MDAMVCLRIAFLSSVVVLAACGGGSGGGGGDTGGSDGDGGNSLQATQRAYDAKRQAAFEGNVGPASLGNESVLPFVRAVTSDEFPPEATQAPATPGLRSKNSDGHPALSGRLSAVHRLLRHSAITEPRVREKSSVRQNVDELRSCSPSGSVRISGTLNNAGLGMLTYDYDNCVLDDVTVDGIVKAWIGESGDIEQQFYDAFSVRGTSFAFRSTGDIAYSYENQSETRSLAYVFDTGFQYQEEDYEESASNTTDGFLTNVTGKLFYGDRGWVEVSASTKLWNQVVLTGNVTLNTPSQQLDADLSGDHARLVLDGLQGTSVSAVTLLYWDDTVPTMVPVSQMGSVPAYYDFSFTDSEYSAADGVTMSLTGLEDADNDALTVTYRWFVNGVWLEDYRGATLPAGTLSYRDEVYVLAEISDGTNTMNTELKYVVVGDAPVQLRTATLPDTATVGQSQQFTALFWDADVPGSDAVPSISYGPPGATINAAGVVSWTPESPLIGKTGTVYFGFVAPTGEQQEHPVQITAPDALEPIVKTGFSRIGDHRQMHALQFDEDPAVEVAVLSEGGFIYTLEATTTGLAQEWTQTRELPLGASPISVESIPGVNHDALLVCTQRAIYRISDANAPYEAIYLSDNFLQQMEVSDIDRDGDMDILVLEEVSGSSFSKIKGIDIATGAVLIEMSSVDSFARIKSGNVDLDPAVELIVNGSVGKIFDLESGVQQGTLPTVMRGEIRVADVTGDGVAEVLRADLNDGLLVYSATAGTFVINDGTYTGGMVTVDNTDGDPAQEIGLLTDKFVILDFGGSSFDTALEHVNASGYVLLSALATNLDSDPSAEFVLFDYQHVLRLDLTNTTPVVWTGAIDENFLAAGYGDILPSSAAAIFVVKPNYYFDDSHVLAMSDDGSLTRYEPGGSVFGQVSFVNVVDENNDGFSELHVADEDESGLTFKSLTLNGFVSRYSMASDHQLSLFGPGATIVSEDMNNDGLQDMVMAAGSTVSVYSPATQTDLGSFTRDDMHQIHDIAVADLNADGIKEIIISDTAMIYSLKRVGGSWVLRDSTTGFCPKFVAGKFEQSGQWQVVCANGFTSFYSGLFVYNSNLELIRQFDYVNFSLLDLAVQRRADGMDELIIAQDAGSFAGNASSLTELATVSTQTGKVISRSPTLLGEVRPNGIKPFVDANGKRRIMVGTKNAMYLSR